MLTHLKSTLCNYLLCFLCIKLYLVLTFNSFPKNIDLLTVPLNQSKKTDGSNLFQSDPRYSLGWQKTFSFYFSSDIVHF